MLKAAEYWKDRADEVRAIADGMEFEKTKRMMLEIAADYDRLAEDSQRRVPQKERDEQLAKHAEAKQVIKRLMEAPFSHARVSVRYPYRDDLRHWEMRSEEARMIAPTMKDPFNRRLMLSIAEAYETLGRRLSDEAPTER